MATNNRVTLSATAVCSQNHTVTWMVLPSSNHQRYLNSQLLLKSCFIHVQLVQPCGF
jgi:hypothetical protein